MKLKLLFMLVIGLALLIVPWLASADVDGGSKYVSKTVLVDCTLSDSIMTALKTNKNVDELIIEIRGICEEHVYVSRPNVTMRGESISPYVYQWWEQDSPAEPEEPIDGIHGPDDDKNVLSIAGIMGLESRVTVENLRLTGVPGGRYTFALNYAIVSVNNVRVDTEAVGATVIGNGSSVTINDSQFVGDRYGFFVRGASSIGCERCIIESTNNWGRGIRASDSAFIGLNFCEVRGNTALQAFGSSVNARNCVIESIPEASPPSPSNRIGGGNAIFAADSSHVDVQTSELIGPIDGRDKSKVFLRNTEHSSPPETFVWLNRFNGDSSLEVAGVTLQQTTEFGAFSNGVFRNESRIEGDLLCHEGSNVWCDESSGADGETNCEYCTPPPPPECPCFNFDQAMEAVQGLRTEWPANVCERINREGDQFPLLRHVGWSHPAGEPGTDLRVEPEAGFCEFVDHRVPPGEPPFVQIHMGGPEEVMPCVGELDGAVLARTPPDDMNAVELGYCPALPTDGP